MITKINNNFVCVCAQSLQLRLILCNPMDYSQPGTSVQGIFLPRILEWVVMPFSRGSSWPRDPTRISYVSCIAGGLFTADPPGKPKTVTLFSNKFGPSTVLSARIQHIHLVLKATWWNSITVIHFSQIGKMGWGRGR